MKFLICTPPNVLKKNLNILFLQLEVGFSEFNDEELQLSVADEFLT